MATLTLQNVRRTYGAVDAVRDVNLDVASGELVCLLGPSGSGKSTLLRLIGGFERPSEGRVRIDGEDQTGVPPERRPTAMVFQSHALWSHMTVAGNIAFGLKLRRLPRAEVARAVDDALGLVGLAGFGDRRVTSLSGGQQQRVAIARCLVLKPKILLMDEPFAALDQHLRERLREEVRELQRRLGITTVFVTHGQEEALAIADRIVVMSMGRVNQVGRPTEIYARPADRFVAGFIGAMNLVDGEVRAGRFVSAAVELPVPVADGPATLAVRPEQLMLAADGPIAGVVAQATHFGAFQHVDVDAGGRTLRLHVGPTLRLRPGEAVRLAPAAFTLYRDDRLLHREGQDIDAGDA